MKILKNTVDLVLVGEREDSFAGLPVFVVAEKHIGRGGYLLIIPENLHSVPEPLYEIKAYAAVLRLGENICLDTVAFYEKGIEDKENGYGSKIAGCVPETISVFFEGDIRAEDFLSYFRELDKLGSEINSIRKQAEKTLGKRFGFAAMLGEKNQVAFFVQAENKTLLEKSFIGLLEERGIIKKGEKYSGSFSFRHPMLGRVDAETFFVRDVFVISFGSEISEKIKNTCNKKEKPLSKSKVFKSMAIPSENNGVVYVNVEDLLKNLPRLAKIQYPVGIFDAVKFVGGYTKISGNTVNTRFVLKLLDLSQKEWKKRFLELCSYYENKNLYRKEHISMINLQRIRDILESYKAARGKYPETLEHMVPEYIKEVPAEVISGSKKEINEYNGKGGWYYSNGRISINIAGTDTNGKYYSEW